MELPTSQGSAPGAPRARLAGTSPAWWAWLLASAALGWAAYRPLLTLRLDDSLSRELEGWFFVPADSSPVFFVALALWLTIRRWERLRRLPRAKGGGSLAAGGGLAALGTGAAAWAVYTRAPDLMAGSLALEGLALAALLRGGAGVRGALVPALVLLLAVRVPPPLINELAFRLQLWTADYTGWLLYLLDMPALVSGDQILRSTARFAVIENCSGLRSMETLGILAILMADLFRRRGLHAVALLLAAPVIAFGLNGLRVLTLIVNPHAEIASIHNLQGIAILLGGLVVLYLLDGLLERLLGRALPRDAHAGAALEAASAAGREPRGAARLAARHWLCTGALAIAAAVVHATPGFAAPQRIPAGLQYLIPPALDGWQSVDLAFDETFLGTIAMQQHLLRSYSSPADAAPVELYVGIGNHARSTRGPFSPKTGLPGSGWIVEERGAVALGDTGRVAELRAVRSAARRQLVYHWREGSAGLLDEVVRSLLALDRSPWHRRRDSVVVRLSTPLDGTGAPARREADARLQRFQRDLRLYLDGLDENLAWKRFS